MYIYSEREREKRMENMHVHVKGEVKLASLVLA